MYELSHCSQRNSKVPKVVFPRKSFNSETGSLVDTMYVCTYVRPYGGTGEVVRNRQRRSEENGRLLGGATPT